MSKVSKTKTKNNSIQLSLLDLLAMYEHMQPTPQEQQLMRLLGKGLPYARVVNQLTGLGGYNDR